MSVQQRSHGVRVLKAVSSAVRLHILNLLFDHDALSYTELMSLLKMSPSRDAGRFAYHLKFLLKAGLIEVDVESKKYRLTDLGKMVIDVAEEIEKKRLKSQKILVRTSRFTLEEFDVNRITDSLVREAGMPVEMAQKVAKEAEKRLLKARTRYLTAPLIREVVNGILIEKGLEEYRPKLTRLGLPVYDVSAFLSSDKTSKATHLTHEEFGKTVLREYMLLNVLPRDIADAYLSGEIHIHNLSSWILKPCSVIHDLRFFIKNGLNPQQLNTFKPSCTSPKSLESALNTIFNVLLFSARETCEAQTLEYFNIFLAPFIRGLSETTVKETLKRFLFNISWHVDASFNLDLTMPSFLEDKQAFGVNTNSIDTYGSYVEESQTLASIILDVFSEENMQRPFLNPTLTVKIRRERMNDSDVELALIKACNVVAHAGTVYFANISGNSEQYSVFSPPGFVLKADLNGDWEIDTLRTGVLGFVTINLPRIAYECEKDRTRFFNLLKERVEMAKRALEIKNEALKQRGKNFLPFLMQSTGADKYFRLENSAHLVNIVGLRESAEAFSGKRIYDDEQTLDFAVEITRQISENLLKSGRRQEKRLLLSALPYLEVSERLARQDIERYGIAKVRFQGTREKPYYQSISRIALQNSEIAEKTLAVEKKLNELLSGGKSTVIELGDVEYTPETLLRLTKRFAERGDFEYFIFNRNLTHCNQCGRSWFGLLHKCPSCGSVGTLTFFKRYP